MKVDIIEKFPNGNKKHKIRYYPNGNKWYEQFYDLQGCEHREHNLPDYQEWYENGILYHKTYTIHGKRYNINNPSNIKFNDNGKVWFKYYYLNDYYYSKLTWMNCIKNI